MSFFAHNTISTTQIYPWVCKCMVNVRELHMNIFQMWEHHNSCVNLCSILQTKYLKEQVFNILDATRGGIVKHTKGTMPKISSTCVHIMRKKEQVFKINMATQISK